MENNTFDTKNIVDRIRLIGELEHLYFHAKMSASVAKQNNDEDMEIFHQTVASKAQRLRREYMTEHFGQMSDELWCEGKVAASLRQVAYETDTGDTEMLAKIDDLVNMVWGKITNQDLSGCKACKEDRKE